MKISLHQLNESWQALARLANKEFPKEQHKLSYKLARIYKQAKSEVEEMGQSLQALMRKCGIIPGERNTDTEKVEDFNQRSKQFLKETEFEFTWGEPIRFEELREHVSITPADLAELDWLIAVEEEPQAKAAVA